MPTLFVFLLKVNIALLLFCAGYYLVLRRLTFYTLNRIYLVSAIVFASLYPKINLSDFVQRHQQITKPVEAIVFNWQTPAKKFAGPFSQPNYWYWVETAFWIGAALLAMRLLTQLFSLYKLYRNSAPAQIYGHRVRVVNGKAGPFSFWKSIYVNPSNHEPADLRAILLHEQVHVNEWHTLDILLAELSIIFYWFNPGIWLMKKAIRENIEFITDRKILDKGVDTKQYQYSLVNVGFSVAPQGIANHFNISTIKKRIIMMNAKRSSKVNLTRYAFLVPAVVVLLLVFSISKAALIKKSNNVNKSLPAKIKANNASITTNNVMALKNGLNNKATSGNGKALDTIKKGGFYLSSSHHSDSLNYVINGKKATKADFVALDTDRIYSIEIMPAERASKIYKQADNKNNVLFVTTNDSEEGKRFKEKIDKVNGIAYVNKNIVTISRGDGSSSATVARGMGESFSIENENSAGSDVVITDVAPRMYKIRPKKIRPFRHGADSLTTIINDEPFTQVYTTGPDSGMVYTNRVGKAYTINPKYKITAKPKLTYRYNKAYSPKGFTTVYSSNFDNEANIEHLSEKMIMIDGKEATEHDLKKLSAADIESMSVKSGEEMTEKYGDKAKNGVVFISTKKGGK